jgi:hypothetical protein
MRDEFTDNSNGWTNLGRGRQLILMIQKKLHMALR